MKNYTLPVPGRAGLNELQLIMIPSGRPTPKEFLDPYKSAISCSTCRAKLLRNRRNHCNLKNRGRLYLPLKIAYSLICNFC
jgi:hypothetical protein